MFDITSLGELLIDFTSLGQSESKMSLFEQNPGGAPANVAAAMSKFGAKAAFIGKVGNDMHGIFLKGILEKEGINTEGLIIDNQVFTTLAFVSLDEKGERKFSFARKPGADTMLTKEEVNVKLIKESKIFHIGSLSLTDEPAKSATLYALINAKKAGCTISYDPNYREPLWNSKAEAVAAMQMVIPYVDVMKISDEETELLTSHKEPAKAAKELVEQGTSIVVVTLGAKGAYVCTKEGGIIVPGFKSRVIDTTGAGDSFWGGFLFKLIQGGKKPSELSLDEAATYAYFANAVASLCIEKRGGIMSMPNIAEVYARLSV